ncbi:MAG: hypothetical protein J2P17_01070 [Mycobacterium sp.]|nr:hypothetical protein [Mycobacterium sp.]
MANGVVPCSWQNRLRSGPFPLAADITADTAERSRILTDLSGTLDTWFQAHPGQQWRDPKGYTIIVAYR